jgi:hypothetical protein
LFDSKRRLQEQRPHPPKTVLGSSLDKDGFSKVTSPKSVLGWSLGENVGFGDDDDYNNNNNSFL